jgi:F0F1-type ATP synthase assembly protein I
MEPGETPGRAIGTGYRYVSMGMTFAAGIVLFTGLGYLVDHWLGLLPFGTIAGTILGAVLSFMWVYQKLLQDQRDYEAEHPEYGRKRPR